MALRPPPGFRLPWSSRNPASTASTQNVTPPTAGVDPTTSSTTPNSAPTGAGQSQPEASVNLNGAQPETLETTTHPWSSAASDWQQGASSQPQPDPAQPRLGAAGESNPTDNVAVDVLAHRLSNRDEELGARVKEARELALAGLVWWTIIHFAAAAAVFLLPTSLHRDAVEALHGAPCWWQPAAYLALFTAAVLQYRALSRSSPGYLAEVFSLLMEPKRVSPGLAQVEIGNEDKSPGLAQTLDADGYKGGKGEEGESIKVSEGVQLSPEVDRGTLPSSGSTQLIPEDSRRAEKGLLTPLLSRTPALARRGWCDISPGSWNSTRSLSSLAASSSDNEAGADVGADADPLMMPVEPGVLGMEDWSRVLEKRSKRSCPYCQLAQPVRTKHCYDCGKCVLQFDHHCAWVGTCIGWQNHRCFWWYLLFDSSLAAATLAADMSAIFGPEHGRSSWGAFSVAMVLAAFITLALLFLGTLLVFHTYIILTNQTTYEATLQQKVLYLRDIPPSVHPFSRGLFGNLYLACCLPKSVLPLYFLPTLAQNPQ